MGDLKTYFGNDFMKELTKKAMDNSKEFRNQTGSTKIALADTLAIENETRKLAEKELIEVLDDIEAKNELNQKVIKQYENVYGEKNENFIKNHNISVTRTEEKIHAKKALADHMNKKYNQGLNK